MVRLTCKWCESCKIRLSQCPICSGNLEKYLNLIPTSAGNKAISGQYCHRCHRFFTEHAALLIQLIESSPEKDSFYVDDKPLNSWQKPEQNKYVDVPVTIRGHETIAYSNLNGNTKATLYNCYPCPRAPQLIGCPICGKKAIGFVNPIVISKDRFVKIHGQACCHCNAFFTSEEELLLGTVEESPQKARFQINRCFDCDSDCSRHFEAIGTPPSMLSLITVCAKNDVRIYTIVTDIHEVSLNDNILYYTHEIARTLLTAVVLKDKTVELDGKKFTIEDVRKNETPFGFILTPSAFVEVHKRKNGGYYTSNSRYELVNGLVFCEKSHKLEVLPVSYDKIERVYFVDRTVYDKFCAKFGLPIIHPVASKAGDGYAELHEESLLRHYFGYNVNAKEGMSSGERHRILAQCVDLGYMEVKDIVNLLKSLIRRNGARNPQCVPKWQNDLDFIQNYKINPERFVFVQRIRNL